MSSAQSPKPTIEVRKFMFDRSFDVEAPKKPKKEEVVEEKPAEAAAEPQVVAPTFSEEQMQAARDEAFQQGRSEGAAETRASTEREIKVSLDGILGRLKELSEAQEKANAAILDTAVIVAVGIARKLFPTLSEKHALAEIERMIGLALEHVLEEPKIIVYVNAGLKAPLEERAAGLVAKAGFKGEMSVEGVDDIIVGDCRVEWTGGGARRSTDELWQEIDEIVERNLADDTKTDTTPAAEAVDSGDESAAVEGDAGGAILEDGGAAEATPATDGKPDAPAGGDAATERKDR